MQLPISAQMTPREGVGSLYYSFASFDAVPFVRHGFSTRLGGVSRGPFSAMNLSFTRGDEAAAVRENFALFCENLGMKAEDVVVSAQEHHTNLYNATAADRGRGVTRERGYTDIDGLLTDEPGVVLCTQYADCVPLFFVDPVRKVVATSHAGWKGTAARIGRITVDRMARGLRLPSGGYLGRNRAVHRGLLFRSGRTCGFRIRRHGGRRRLHTGARRRQIRRRPVGGQSAGSRGGRHRTGAYQRRRLVYPLPSGYFLVTSRRGGPAPEAWRRSSRLQTDRGRENALRDCRYGALLFSIQLSGLGAGDGPVLHQGAAVRQPWLLERPYLPDLRLRGAADFHLSAPDQAGDRVPFSRGAAGVSMRGGHRLGAGICHFMGDGKAVPCQMVGLFG